MLQPVIQIDETRRLIRVEFDPRAGVEDWRSSQSEIARLAKEKGYHRILVDVRNQESRNVLVLDMFTFGAELPVDMVIAVLSDPRRDDHIFVETVALNRGKKVKLFFGIEDDAIRWLVSLQERSA